LDTNYTIEFMPSSLRTGYKNFLSSGILVYITGFVSIKNTLAPTLVYFMLFINVRDIHSKY